MGFVIKRKLITIEFQSIKKVQDSILGISRIHQRPLLGLGETIFEYY